MSNDKVLDDELERALGRHVELVKAKIRSKSLELAEKAADGETTVSVLDLAKAIETYAPGKKIDQKESASTAKESFLSQLPPITTISAVLAVAFGIIGVIAIQFGEAKGIEGKGFIDIAKIFAGAIVGSATVSMTGRKRKP